VESGELAERLRRDSGGDVDAAWAMVANLEAEVAALAEDYGRGAITRAEWNAARGGLTARLDAARRGLERTRGAESVVEVAGGLAAWDAAWAAGLEGKRRAMLAAVLESVQVAPAVRGRNRFDTGRLRLVWRS
jgi:hypothetical protein